MSSCFFCPDRSDFWLQSRKNSIFPVKILKNIIIRYSAEKAGSEQKCDRTVFPEMLQKIDVYVTILTN